MYVTKPLILLMLVCLMVFNAIFNKVILDKETKGNSAFTKVIIYVNDEAFPSMNYCYIVYKNNDPTVKMGVIDKYFIFD
jgi:hypothetical protein